MQSRLHYDFRLLPLRGQGILSIFCPFFTSYTERLGVQRRRCFCAVTCNVILDIFLTISSGILIRASAFHPANVPTSDRIACILSTGTFHVRWEFKLALEELHIFKVSFGRVRQFRSRSQRTIPNREETRNEKCKNFDPATDPSRQNSGAQTPNTSPLISSRFTERSSFSLAFSR